MTWAARRAYTWRTFECLLDCLDIPPPAATAFPPPMPSTPPQSSLEQQLRRGRSEASRAGAIDRPCAPLARVLSAQIVQPAYHLRRRSRNPAHSCNEDVALGKMFGVVRYARFGTAKYSWLTLPLLNSFGENGALVDPLCRRGSRVGFDKTTLPPDWRRSGRRSSAPSRLVRGWTLTKWY
jgi:hypothetical protein